MRPHTQLSFELCMWAEGDQCCPTMDTLMLLFVDLLSLGVTVSFRNEKWSPSSFYGSPQIYLLKVLLCVSAPCQVSLWSQANSLTEHAPEPSSSWSDFCHLSSHTPPCSSSCLCANLSSLLPNPMSFRLDESLTLLAWGLILYRAFPQFSLCRLLCSPVWPREHQLEHLFYSSVSIYLHFSPCKLQAPWGLCEWLKQVL